MASVGPATTQQIAFEMLKRSANLDMIHVPYAGGAPAVTALLGGHVTAVIANYSEVEQHLKSGKLRALATASRKRIASAPDVPSVAESGYQDYESEVWFGIVARPDAGRDDRPASGLVWLRARDPGGQAEAAAAGNVSGRKLRRGLRHASAPSVRRLCPRDPRSRHQGRMSARRGPPLYFRKSS